MMTCCFFGHHDMTEEIQPRLEHTIRSLIVTEGIADFLVGNQGRFDRMVLSALRKLQLEFPHISYKVVLAYLPTEKNAFALLSPMETLYPEGLETVPKRFAMSKRNDWMLSQADVVVCYVWHHFGGAGKAIDKALRQNKRVINLAEQVSP